MKRRRADQLVVERGLAATRTKAQALVLAGEVFVGTERVAKPGDLLAVDCDLRVAARQRFVSRGGDKLEGALADFAPTFDDLAGVVAVDVGASTGGFTDCLLQRGAAKVYAVDVGYGQLHDKLLREPRVVSRERTNARDLTAAAFEEPIDLLVVDASFIGLGVLVPAIARTLAPGGALVALVKPQFEVGREVAARGRGVVRDAALRDAAVAKVRAELGAAGLTPIAEARCKIAGPKGNVEHFIYARLSSR